MTNKKETPSERLGQDCSSALHPDLILAQKLCYEPNGLVCKDFVKQVESAEYGAYLFNMNKSRILFRVAKITPTKCGQFVTLWKREYGGPIQPYDIADPIDFFVVSVRHAERLGQFVFSKATLVEQGVVAEEGRGGKRAIRVYPSWNRVESRQAVKTQEWQLRHFFEITSKTVVDSVAIRRLFFNPNHG